jgi:EmrB/QacA subfamily drug resistance transporter
MVHASQRPSRDASSRRVLAIVCAGVVLASLDLFIVNVALPQIAADFHVQDGLADLSWVLNAYAIVYAALLVLFGRLADRFPRERGFLVGVAIFVTASAACGAATSVAMLVAFRVVQAAGAALLTPTSLGLVLASTAPERRHGAVRTWAAVGGLAAALGPVVGGLLVAVDWRWVFFVNVPIGIAALIAGRRWLPHVPGHQAAAPDALGALLITAGVALLTLGLVKGGDWGWGSTTTLAVLTAAAAGVALFVVHTAHHRNPLIDRRLFALRAFTGASTVALVFSTAFGAMLLSRVLWMQDVWDWSALRTGLAIAPGPLMVPLFAAVGGRLVPRLGAGSVIAAGCAIFAAGAAWWAFAAGVHPDYAGEMLGGMLLTGVGTGLALPTLMAAGSASLPAHSFATGSAVVNMLRQIGMAIGVAVLIAVLGTPHTAGAVVHAYRDASIVIAVTALAAGAVALTLLSRRRAPMADATSVPAVAAEAAQGTR